MKKVLTTSIMVFLFFSAQSQVWFEVGGKAMYGMKGFYNDNIFNDRGHQYQFGSGLAYGGVLCINIADKNGFNIEGLLAKNEQKFEYIANNDKITNDLNWKTLDLYLLYRHYSNSAFIELGPKYSKLNSISQSYGDPITLDGEYNDSYFSAVFGFGGLITGSEFFTLKSGIRFEYALGDFVSEKGKAGGFPAYYANYDKYTATHPFSAGVYLSLNFAIGAVAKAECGRRRFVFGSGY